MNKKNIKLKRIISFTILVVTLITSAVFASSSFAAFTVEHGIGETLTTIGGIQKGKLTYVYTERDKLIKEEGGEKTLNVIESTSEDGDDAMEEFNQSADGTTRNKLRYMYGGYLKSPSEPDEFKGFTPFLNSTSRPAEPNNIKDLMEFLNSHKNPLGSCTTSPHSINNTCKFALQNFYNFYCLLLQKDVIGWHSYINRVVDGAKRDISQYFNPIKSWSDYTVYANSNVAHGFDDYFEGSRDNEAALKGHTNTFALEYPIPGAPTPGVYPYGALMRRDNLTTKNVFVASTSRSELFFGGDPRQTTAVSLRNMAQNSKSNDLGVTTEAQSIYQNNLMANLNDALLEGDTDEYQLPGIDDSLGFHFPEDYDSTATMNKYDVRPNNQRTLTRYSNATYFLYPFSKNEDGYESPTNLYDIDNDGNSCNRQTNTYSYGLAFSKKHTRPNGRGIWERGQAAVWAGTGAPKFSYIGVNASSLDEDIFGDETPGGDASSDIDIDDNHDSITAEGYDPNKTVLYLAGRALDLYEQQLTGGKSLADHNRAVKGSTPGGTDTLKNKVIVSTKPKGSIAPNGTINDDFTDDMIGSTSDATGTILLGEEGEEQYYLIGPFLMSDYVYAASEYVAMYSGKDTERYKSLIGGIVSGELTLSSDNGGEQKVLIGVDEEKEAQIVYENPKDGNYKDDKTEWKGGLDSYKDSGSPSFLQDVDEIFRKENGIGYEFPRPKSTFYIKVRRTTCGNMDTLKNIRFVYRQTYSDGDGWVIAARYIKSQWRASAISNGCEGGYTCDNYPATSCTPPPASPHTLSSCGGVKGDYDHTDYCTISPTCDGYHYCNHDMSDNCGGYDDDGNAIGCVHSHSSCDYSWTCQQRVYCGHGYRWCLHTSEYTLLPGAKIIKAQPTLALHKTKVDLRDYCFDSEVNIRLTTDLTVNKFIYDVEHCPDSNENTVLQESGYNSTFPEAMMDSGDNGLGADYTEVTREKLQENVKNANPVYVEYGDIVTYHIQLINKQKKDVTVKIMDTIPKNAIVLSIQNITEQLVTSGITDDTGNSTVEFKPQREFADGSDSSLDVLLQDDPKTKVHDKDDEPKDTRFNEEQFFTTDWIGVPGRKSGQSNIVTIAVRVKVLDWENTQKWENKVKIITRNSGPKGTFGDDDYVEDYMRVVNNGVKRSELEGERDKYNKYPPDTTFPIENTTGDPNNETIHGPVVNIAELNGGKLESSDWYQLNNYNAFIDKYIYKYDEKMQQNNNNYKFTNQSYMSAPRAGDAEFYYEGPSEADVLVKSRENTSDEYDEDYNDDGNILDRRREISEDEDEKYNEKSKKAYPLSAEKTEKVTYAIKVMNDATIVDKREKSARGAGHISGSKPATQVRPSQITDFLETGLEYKSIETYIYDKNDALVTRYSEASDGKVNASSSGSTMATTDVDGRRCARMELKIDDKTILNPGDYIVYFITVEITESNMYLYDLMNRADINKLTNINKEPDDGNPDEAPSRIVAELQRNSTTLNYRKDENIAIQKSSSDWIRLKDLVIAGRVWIDFNRDGYMNESDVSDQYKDYYSVDNYGRKREVKVFLYRSDQENEPLRETQTDSEGFYTFSRQTGGAYYKDYNYCETESNVEEYNADETYQRVDKAETKDKNGNYEEGAQYIDYYVEFEYDGVLYKSTEFYSGTDNIDVNESSGTYGKYDEDNPYSSQYAIHRDDGTKGDNYEYKYEVDSNAAEFRDVRMDFDRKYEYISYNNASATMGGSTGRLEFDKTEHTSQLLEDKERKMYSRSFIKNATMKNGLPSDINSYYWYDDGISVDKSLDNTDLLWLCKLDGSKHETRPETEHLKHINLGLELREDVDITLIKDVYEVKTTIDGETMIYNYDQNKYIAGPDGKLVLNGDIDKSNVAENHRYLQDYIIKEPYGLELYESDYKYRFEQYVAAAVKEYKESKSELNIEVTFKITVNNKDVTDDDTVKDNRGNKPEVKDSRLTVKINEILDLYDVNFMELGKKDPVTIKVKDDKGFLKDIETPIPLVEAWYMSGDSKVPVAVSPTPKFQSKANNFTDNGYYTLYMDFGDGLEIPEGESREVFVKYIVDKDALEIDVNSNYENTTEKTVKKVDGTYGDIKVEFEEVLTKTSEKGTLERSLKIDERGNKTGFEEYSRGTENIAQVNAYSVWYPNRLEASIVDMDSNAGNIGIQTGRNSSSLSSADDVTLYEDMTYKTGIEIYAEGTENTKKDVEERHTNLRLEGNGKITRSLKGMVWDDARTDTTGPEDAVQYIGDGLYDTSKTKNPDAKMNDNVKENYTNTPNEETKDIKVRNARAELVEIVQTDETHYYEEILSNVTWEQIQHARTIEDGSYELTGFIPGRYVVRFTYGDTVEANSGGTYNPELIEQKDMLVFNGQDYKSTKYYDPNLDSIAAVLEHSPDGINNVMDALEKENKSDARDDEVRRLEANGYSETMVNRKAEVLKGVANGTKLTNTKLGDENNEIEVNYYEGTKNSEEDLKELTDKMYINAETVEFLVRAEKEPRISKTYAELENIDFDIVGDRHFEIKNIDFGIEYRPETKIDLTKEISNIKLQTSDGELILNLVIDTKEEVQADGKIKIEHIVDPVNSTGAEKVQFITNDYANKNVYTNELLSGIVINEENIQGIAYVAVDSDILQGCTVIVEYKFTARNDSEVDRISKNLNIIRFYENEKTLQLIEEIAEVEPKDLRDITVAEDLKTEYVANKLASNTVYKNFFKTEENDKYSGVVDIYREKTKAMTNTGEDEYYGQYVGYTYYVGDDRNTLDTISELKYDKIIDYVDTDLEFGQLTQTDITKINPTANNQLGQTGSTHGSGNSLLDALDDRYVKDQDFIGNQYWTNNSEQPILSLSNLVRKLWWNQENDPEKTLIKSVLTDLDGVEYKSLVMTVPDKLRDTFDDSGEIIDEEINEEVNNNLFSRFLLPSAVNKEKSIATVSLPVSKLIASETDAENMAYENIAEVVQFTLLTGRRTNFDVTIGNADIHEVKDQLERKKIKYDGYGSIEFVTAGLESDTAATETITLAPPTGLMRNRRVILETVETTRNIVTIVVIAIAVIVTIAFVTKFVMYKMKKRRYK